MPLDLAVATRRLHVLACWSTVAGEGTGFAVSIDLGVRRPRARPVRNPHLSAEQREYTGEVSIFIRCAWRLVGATVQHVEALRDGRDLVLGFDRSSSTGRA